VDTNQKEAGTQRAGKLMTSVGAAAPTPEVVRINSFTFDGSSAAPVVDAIMERVLADNPLSVSVSSIVRSFVWSWTIHRSCQGKKEYSMVEFPLYCLAFRKMSQRLTKYASPEGAEYTFTKYHIDKWMWRGVRSTDDPPPRPLNMDGQLFETVLSRDMARAVRTHDLGFLYSVQKGTKQAWARANKRMVIAACKKHAKCLSSSHGVVESQDLAAALRRTAHTIFDSRPFEPTKFLPTTSACQQASYGSGALSLTEKLELDPELRIGLIPRTQVAIASWQRDHLEFWTDEIEACWNDTARRAELLTVTAVPLTELGGKVRIITKGDGLLYSCLQPLQQHMLSCWKHCEASTMLIQDLTASVQSMRDALVPPHLKVDIDTLVFVSGDYSAATDLMKKNATFHVLSGLEGTDVPAPQKLWAARSFLPGEVNYPEKYEKELPPVMGIDGQLMGHPLSFPILCIVNLSVLKVALERWSRDQPDLLQAEQVARVILKHAKINGDDILFCAPDTVYPYFRSVAAEAGFQISQGKNYVSKFACTINSQLFSFNKGIVERVGYFNQTLLTGSVKKTVSANVSAFDLAAAINQTFQLYPRVAAAVPTVLKRAEKLFTPRTFRGFSLNWYLPVHLGGLGIDIRMCPNVKYQGEALLPAKVDRLQRRVAARAVTDGGQISYYLRKRSSKPTMLALFEEEKMVVGDYVPSQFESLCTESEIDGWSARCMTMDRMMHKEAFVEPESVFRLTSRGQRLKPMSLTKLGEYAAARFYCRSRCGLVRPPSLPLLPCQRVAKQDMAIRFSNCLSYMGLHDADPQGWLPKTVTEMVQSLPPVSIVPCYTECQETARRAHDREDCVVM
jgi:hypothetical protein